MTLSFVSSKDKDHWLAHYITDLPGDVKTRFVNAMALYFEFEAQDVDSSQVHQPTVIHCSVYVRHCCNTHPLVHECAESKWCKDLSTNVPLIAQEF